MRDDPSALSMSWHELVLIVSSDAHTFLYILSISTLTRNRTCRFSYIQLYPEIGIWWNLSFFVGVLFKDIKWSACMNMAISLRYSFDPFDNDLTVFLWIKRYISQKYHVILTSDYHNHIIKYAWTLFCCVARCDANLDNASYFGL